MSIDARPLRPRCSAWVTATRWKPAHRCTRPANYVATVGRLKVDVCYRHVMQEYGLVLAKVEPVAKAARLKIVGER